MSVFGNVPKIVLNAYLECPVCLDFAVSPIHTCKNGHLVCGICEEKTKICPTCQADDLMVNKFVERVLKAEEVVVPCRNSQHGCALLVPLSEMKTHLAESCDSRKIQCYEGGEDCDRQSYHPKELLNHWVEVHYTYQRDLLIPPSNSTNSLKGLLGTIIVNLALSDEDYKIECRNDAIHSGVLEYVEIDNRTFTLHNTTEGGTFHAWVTLLGMESDASKYGFVATLSSHQDKPEKRITFPRIPVHSVQYCSTKKVDELGHTANVRVTSLKSIQDENPNNPDYYFEWKVRFDIYNVEDPTHLKLE